MSKRRPIFWAALCALSAAVTTCSSQGRSDGEGDMPAVDRSVNALAANTSPGAQARPDVQYLNYVHPTRCDRYLDAAAGNDNNSGSAAAPWRSFRKALSSLVAGEIACVRPGTYGETRNETARHGEPTRPIVIRAADPARRPLILVSSSTYGPVLQIRHSYWVIDGFVINVQDRATLAIDLTTASHHITLRNSEVFNGGGGVAVALNGDDLYITHNRVHDNFFGSEDAHAFATVPNTGASRILIEGNVVYNNGGDGYQCDDYPPPIDSLTPTDITIEDNELYTTTDLRGQVEEGVDIKKCQQVTIRRNRFHGFPHSSVLIHYGTLKTLVEGNIIYDSGDGVFVGHDNLPTHDTVIRSNLFFQINQGSTGGSAIIVAKSQNVDIYNNTFDSIGGAALRIGIDNWPEDAGTTFNTDVWNNIIYNANRWIHVDLTTASDLESDYNLFFNSDGTTRHICSTDDDACTSMKTLSEWQAQ